mgnify:CR=1 FL=1
MKDGSSIGEIACCLRRNQQNSSHETSNTLHWTFFNAFDWPIQHVGNFMTRFVVCLSTNQNKC